MEAEPVAHLDDNILHEILSRLPTKPLARCKLISKAWNDMISSPLFVAAQTKRSISRAVGIYSIAQHGHSIDYISLDDDVGAQEVPRITLGFLDPDNYCEGIQVKAECNGLVFFKLTSMYILKNYTVGNPLVSIPKLYILSNPTTNSYLEVCEPELDKSYDARFGLAFDPFVSPRKLKLVMCWRYEDNHSHEDDHSLYNFTIYSPMTKKWQVSTASISCRVSLMFSLVSRVFLNGALHWLRETDIVAFNVEEERAYLMRLPEVVNVSSVEGYPNVWLGAVGGRMTIVRFDNGILVYEMEDYRSGRWKLKKNVEMEKGSGGYCGQLVPVFYDGEICMFFTSKLAEYGVTLSDYGLAVYRIWEKRWDEFRRMSWRMRRHRYFFPDISNMVVLKL